MRPEGNPLDLNNLPDDYSRDHGKQVLEEGSSSAGYRKKKSGAKDGKDESGKVYECRFCSLKFCKSQALGGHMNRHRQERETETLNKARQLVYMSNDNLAAQPLPHHHHHLPGSPHGGSYHQAAGNMGTADPTLQFRPPVYPPRLFPGSSSTLLPPPPPPHQPYMYTSPSRLVPYPSPQYGPPHPPNDYFVGHVLNPNYGGPPSDTNYTCIGAPVGHAFPPHGGGGGRGSDTPGASGGGGGHGRGTRDADEGLNWGRSYAGTQQQQHLNPSSINRFQDGF